MGVKGLWSLLNPVARPIQIESMEGKRLAIDSSIWLYQFQATMRDKDGRVLVNAHVLGFLRRINKLLFHGIKPVFVFDGGAPVLKRATIAERKRRKAGAAANHARMAEKLFAAQMRREAVKVAQSAREEQAAQDSHAAATRYATEAGDQIAEDAVYLEDLEGRPGPSRPPPQPTTRTPSTQSIPAPAAEVDPKEERRKKFKKHDPYRLPETDMPTVSTAEKPDARLATEEELKQFIDEMHPEDIDVDSPEFRALPTEVQYEIIGDLRIRSRQQSHRRLAEMLRAAPTALDFSRAQIKHLSQRNALTQQLLTVTDMVGKAHLTIPIRIAAERNREYVLVKRNEDEGGGWALGIREGTKANPIKVADKDDSDSEDDSDSDSEATSEDAKESDDDEIKAISPPVQSAIDPDLREFRRREMLDAIVRRYAPPKPVRPSLDIPVKSFGKRREPGAAPLFEDSEDVPSVLPTANDEALALALQQEELGSDEETADQDLAQALALSRMENERKKGSEAVEADVADEDEMEEIQWTDKESEKSEVIDNRQSMIDLDPKSDDSTDELEEVSLVPSASNRSTPLPFSQVQTPVEIIDSDSDSDGIVEVPAPLPSTSAKARLPLKQVGSTEIVTSERVLAKVDQSLQQAKDVQRRDEHNSLSESVSADAPPPPPAPSRLVHPSEDVRNGSSVSAHPTAAATRPPSTVTSNRADSAFATRNLSKTTIVDDAAPPAAGPSTPPKRKIRLPHIGDAHLPDFHPETPETKKAARDNAASMPQNLRSPSRRAAAPLLAFMDSSHYEDPLMDLRAAKPPPVAHIEEDEEHHDDDEEEGDDSRSIEWSKSPSPRPSRPLLQPEQSGDSIPMDVEEDEADMNREDMDAEEDDYARFMASIKNRDLNEVRTEIDDEIRILNNQAKVSLRDSDEITQAMISQIQTLLRHFGIPYITAPMEAEAQCAKLAELDLVDGIITDDSDVFLFGGKQCFKNIFNDAKYAECFLVTDIERELSLTRERLISLAYLLGSDYTIGLPGVGPVVALELLANFPGESGISDFKEWWTRVQRGQDSEFDTDTKWKKSFKKRYSTSIFITTDWPNLLVREAYKYPETDESKEPFHWGFPKLSALRAFLHEELSWSISKVDDELTPIVQRIARRGKVGQLNKQSTLNGFFDLSVVSGNYAPRRRTTANVSKRLMAVIKQFREAEARVKGVQVDSWGEMMDGLDEEDPKGRGTGKRREKRKQSTTGPDEADEKLKEVPVDEKGEMAGAEKKKRKTRPRKGTLASVTSIGESEYGSESLVSSADADTTAESIEIEGNGRAQAVRGKRAKRGGRGKGRGTRRWVGERWDVIERPD